MGDNTRSTTRQYHLALYGKHVTRDWDLIGRLKHVAHVLLVSDKNEVPGEPLNEAMMNSINLILFESSASRSDLHTTILPALKSWKRRYPGLSTILINGGLNQEEIATAFEGGIRDYFSYPYNVELLVDRVHHLCHLSIQRNREINT